MADVAESMPIANIVLGEIINETTNESYIFDTAEKADIKPDLSKGKEDILRVKDRIIAINRTLDICIGYTTQLTDNTFNLATIALVDGGTIGTDGNYQGAEVGKVAVRTPYTLNLYSEEKDYDSSTTRYVKFSFMHNLGTPVEYKLEDGKFYVPELSSTSRPKKGEKPVYITYVTALPDGTTSGGDVPSIPVATIPSATTPGVSIGTDYKVTWTFLDAINTDDAVAANFIVTKNSDGSVLSGNVTIDGTGKIVTFVPTTISHATTYTAKSLPVRKADASGNTTATTTVFTTIL